MIRKLEGRKDLNALVAMLTRVGIGSVTAGVFRHPRPFLTAKQTVPIAFRPPNH